MLAVTGRFFFFWLFLAIYQRALIRGRALVALAAIDGLGTVRLEGHLRVHAASGTHGVVHLALRATIATAAAATITAASAAAAITTAAASAGFCGVTARLALAGRLKALALIKFLLFFREGKLVPQAAHTISDVGMGD